MKTNKHKGMGLLIAALLVVGLIVPSAANATSVSFQTSYTFDVDYCGSGCLNGQTGGTVTLSNEGANTVLVSVALNPSLDLFHNTNGFTSLVFNLSGSPTISVSNISNATFALV